MGPNAGVDYNLTLCRLQDIYHGQSNARIDLNLIKSRLYPTVRDFGFGLWTASLCTYCSFAGRYDNALP
jgi:hypothetical protein